MSIPYTHKKSTYDFYVPQTLADDFANFLQHDIPNTVMDFTVHHSWYDQFKDGYEQFVIRGQVYPDSTKSRYANTDNNINFRTTLNSGVRKGDILVDENGVTYLLDWQISPQPNNDASRSLRCNTRLTFKRFMREQVDALGYLIAEQGYKTVAQSIPCNAYRYDGRPEYSAHAGSPGITPNALTIISIQYNEQTKNILEDDEFIWGNDTFIVIDVSPVGLNIDGTSGVLTLQARKKAGGVV